MVHKNLCTILSIESEVFELLFHLGFISRVKFVYFLVIRK